MDQKSSQKSLLKSFVRINFRDGRVSKPKILAFLLVVLLEMASSAALAHGGGLDANGCHTNKRTGDYHCHRAPTVPNKEALNAQSNPRRPLRDDTCYTGPRGGRYRIINGRKRYDC